MIEFACTSCGKQLKVKDEAAGKKGKCPQCGNMVEVPSAETEVNLAEIDAPIQPVRRQQAPPVVQPPPLERGHVAQAPSVNVHMPKRSSSLGIVSLILGVVAFLICWIPLIGVVSIPVSALGVLLAAIGLLAALVRRGSGIGWPIGGGAVSGLALAIGIAQVAALGGAAEAIRQSGEHANRTQQEIVTAGVPSGSTREATARNTPEADMPAAQSPPAAPGPEWASAKNAVRQGDIELRVMRVLTGKVPLRSGFGDGESSSEDDLLAIHLEIINRSQNKKIEYRSWLGRDIAFSRDYATLQDNFGNTYKRISFGFGTKIVGHTESESIYPGKSLGDVLVFELPIDTAEYLRLELPAKNFGGEGMLRLQIPADMIQRQ